ncbi:DUF5979 domain-containing protein [Schaalia vaccimaxillae]|uniref:DUF5979 domain-containing protein n=1 Tax=Schaalia vaccimaxillae TaxID=183916 RepID=UPI00103E4448|nr:DUF5979 domain-containing protein [Schaalia vaccimaxillae]
MRHRSRLVDRTVAVVMAAILVFGSIVGAIFLPTTPDAQAVTETPASVALTITSNRAKVGRTIVNNSGDTTATDAYPSDRVCVSYYTNGACARYQTNLIRYGLIEGKTPYSGGTELTSRVDQFWVTGDQKPADMWSYVARGIPASGSLGTAIQANDQSAIGFQANQLTSVNANEPFLIGTMRHNNNPILTMYSWLHSSLHLDFNGVEEEFPFTQEETSNNDTNVVVQRAGGNYRYYGQPSYNNWTGNYSCGTNLVLARVNSASGALGCYQRSVQTGDYDLYSDDTTYAAGLKIGRANQLPSSDDQVTINKVDSERIVLGKDGVPYRLKIWGFYNNGANQNCPSIPPGSDEETVTYFRTKEGQDTFGCLYGEFQQERYVTISKTATADANSQNIAVPEFSFRTDADSKAEYFHTANVVNDTSLFTGATKQIDGAHAGFIHDGAFNYTLKPTTARGSGGTDNYDLANGTKTQADAYYAFGVGSSGFRIIENNHDTSANRTRSGWKLEGIACVNGNGEDVRVGVDLNSGSVDFSDVGAVTDPKAVPIRCTFHNKYEAKSTLTLRKVVNGGPAAASNWQLAARGTDAVTSGTTRQGTTGSGRVTSTVVPSGEYDLGESLLNQNIYGYELTDLTCRDAAGRTIATRDVDGDGATLAERLTLAPDANVTCTFTNTYSTGRIAVDKLLDGKTDGFAGGGQGFTLSYTCNSGHTGDLTVQHGDPQRLVSEEIPVGATCSITEKNPPTGSERLVNTSYRWTEPSYSAPVTVTKQNTATNPALLSVTNTIVQDTGVLELAKSVKPDQGVQPGYTGGTTRTFPLQYSCSLDGQIVAQGVQNVAADSQVARVEVPAGATCTVSESTQTVQPGDFSANYYDWSTISYAGNDVVVGKAQTKRVTVTNTYKIATVPLTISKAVVGPGGTQANPGDTGFVAPDHTFVVNYTCGPATGQVQVRDGQSVQVQVPRQTACQLDEVMTSLDDATLNSDFDWDADNIRYEDARGTQLRGRSVDVGTQGGTGVVVNPTKRSFGGIAITKKVADPSGLRADARFTYDVKCYAPGVDAEAPGGNQPNHTETVSITLNQVWRLAEDTVPAGSNCLVTETSPNPGSSTGFNNDSYAWTTTSWEISHGQEHDGHRGDARSTIVTAHPKSAEGFYPRVTFTNEFERQYVTLQISKMLDLSSIDLQAIDAHTYSGGFYCKLGDDVMAGSWSKTRDGGPGDAGLATLTLTTNDQGVDQGGRTDTLTLLKGSWCQVSEEPLTTRPYDADAHYVWGAPTITPGTATWADGVTEEKVTVTNTVKKTEANLLITKAVSGGDEGKQYAVGTKFDFIYTCWTDATKVAKVVVNGVTAEGTRSITAGETAELADVTLPAGAYCELHENIDAKHGITVDPWVWDPVKYSNATETGRTMTAGTGENALESPVVSVTVPAQGAITVQANNHLNNRLTNIKVTKQIAGLTEGYVGGQNFTFNVTCLPEEGSFVSGYQGTHTVTIPAGSTTATVDTGALVPVGQHCSVTEVPVSGGLKDTSYTWEEPRYEEIVHGENKTPATVTASIDNSAELKVTNPIKRVHGTVGLTKRITGEGSAADQGRGAIYSGTFTCTYDGQPVAAVGTGTWTVTGPGQATVKAEDGTDLTVANELLPLGSVCAPVEQQINGQPNANDPQYRWKNGDGAPIYTNATVSPETRADMLVTNTVEQKRTPARITKIVTDENGSETTDFLNDANQKFNITVSCAPSLDFNNQVLVSKDLTHGQSSYEQSVPAGWYCRITEDSPRNEWLKDASYSWLEPEITVFNGDTRLTAVDGHPNVYQINDDVTDIRVQVVNQVKRVTGPISLTKVLTSQAQGAVADATKAFTGRYTCIYDGATVSAGTWSSVPGQDAIFAEDAGYLADVWTPSKTAVQTTGGLPLTTSCSFTEDAPSSDDLKNISWSWKNPVFEDGHGTPENPVNVLDTGGARKVVVTNDVAPVYSTLKIVKDYDGSTEAITPGATVHVQLICRNPNDGTRISQSFDLNALGIRNNQADPSVSSVIVDGQVQTVNGAEVDTVRVPAGADCTITEDSLSTKLEDAGSQLVDTSWAWENERYSSQLGDAQSVTRTGSWTATTSADDLLTLTVTNRAKRVYGSLEVEKIVPDATTTETNSYKGRWTCIDEAGDEYTGSWNRNGAGVASLESDQDYDGDGVRNNHVPVGSRCTITETDRPAQPNVKDPSYQWSVEVGAVPVEAVTNVVDTVTSKVATSASNAKLRVTNDQTRRFGSFTITKQVQGATDAVDANGEYWVNYTCLTRSGETVSGLVKIMAGEDNKATIGNSEENGDDLPVTDQTGRIPIGSNCYVKELPPGAVVDGVTAPINLAKPGTDFVWRDTVAYYATNASGQVVPDEGGENRDVKNPGYSFILGPDPTNATVVNNLDPVAQVTKTFAETTQHVGADGAWDGTWDLRYTITVTNPSSKVGVAYGLKDTPSVPEGHTMTTMTVTGPNGTIDVSGQPLASGRPVTLVPDLRSGAVLGPKGWVSAEGEILMTKEALQAAGAEQNQDGRWVIANPDTADVVFVDGELRTRNGDKIALDRRAYLPLSGTHTYTVVLNVTANEQGTGVDRAEPENCRAITPGDAVNTVHNQADVSSNKVIRSAEDCGNIPDSPTFSVKKVNSGIEENGEAIRNSDGSYTAAYDVTVTNTSTTSSKIYEDVTDALTLPDSATLTKVVFTDTHKVGAIDAGIEQQLFPAEVGPWTLAAAGSGDVLAGGIKGDDGTVTGGASRTFHVVVTFTVDSASPNFKDEEYQCGTSRGADGTMPNGIYNLASMEGDTDGPDNNHACQQLNPKLNVKKELEASGGNTGAATFDVIYKITAENLGLLAQNTGVLTDKPGFATGLTINKVQVARTVAELDAAEPVTVDGDGTYKLTDGVVVEPVTVGADGANVLGSNEQVFYIRFNVTLDTKAVGYESTKLECLPGQDDTYTEGNGLFNLVTVKDAGKDSVPTDNDECAPVGPRMIQVKKIGTQTNAAGNNDLVGAEFALFDVDPALTGSQPIAEGMTVDPTNGALFTSSTLEIGKTYWLVETKAPTGHNLMPRPVKFQIGQTDDDKKLTTIALLDGDAIIGTAVSSTDATDSDMAVITVKDTQIGKLPHSGGAGVSPYVWVAMLLSVGAVVIALITMSRRREVRARY